MLRLRSEPASLQDGLPRGSLRLEGRCALRAPHFAAHDSHDGNGQGVGRLLVRAANFQSYAA
jgi:hypothetical protein